MPDLSQYIAINIVLDNSDDNPVLRVVDTSSYPAGVAQQIAGVLSITQPDGISIANNDFTQPDVHWISGALTQPEKPLRLANNSKFQNGGYLITYTVRCAGYTDTVLTKAFNVNYAAPVPVLAANFDNFTPSLSVTDATSWGVSGLNLNQVEENWSATIRSIGGTNETISGGGITLDLAWQGSYYDAAYDVALTVIANYKLNDFVTLLDKIVAPAETFQSEIPPSLSALVDGLTTLKAKVDAGQTNGNLYGNTPYATLVNTYNFAVSVYSHLVKRGQLAKLAGLSSYVYQLQTIFNNGVAPTIVNTNTPIPAYDWGGGSGASDWNSITGKPAADQIQWTVGDNGYPGAGAVTIASAKLVGRPAAAVAMIRTSQFDQSATKANAQSNTLIWTTPLGAGELITIKISAL